MAENEELSGRVVRIDRNFANIAVSGRAGIARLDRSVARRITGSYIDDVRDILEINTQVKVRIVPMSEEALLKFPQRIRMTVRRNSQWEVKFFKRDIEPAPQVSQFDDLERYFTDIISFFSGVPREAAVSESTGASAPGPSAPGPSATGASSTGASSTGASSTGASATGASAPGPSAPGPSVTGASSTGASTTGASAPGPSATGATSTGASSTGASSTGASATGASAPGPSATGASSTGASSTAASATGGPVDFKDVLSQTQIIDSVEDCNRVLDPILDQSTRETVIIGLDCTGVNLGKEEGCLTLVQISTWDKKAFLFDAFKNPQLLKGNSSLKKILEHDSILKVIHFCKSDTYHLHHGFGVTLRNVFDTSIAINTLLEEANMICKIHFAIVCEIVGVGGFCTDSDFVEKMMQETPDFWKIRPLTEEMIYYAASDALCLVPRGYTELERFCKELTPLQRALITSSCKDDVENIQLGNEQMTSESRLSCLKRHPPFMINIEDSDDSDDSDDSYSYDGDDDYFPTYNSDDDYFGAYDSDW